MAMKANLILSVVAVTALLSLTACGSGNTAPASAGEEQLAMPAIDASNGLVIRGETIADADLLAAALKDTVVVYTGASQEAEQAVLDRFKAETGIESQLTRMAPSKLFERVTSENAVGKLTAEIIRTADKVMADKFLKEGVFVPYKAPFNDAVDSSLVHPDGGYVTHAFSTYGIAYNSQLVDEQDAPKSWEEMADPRWKGKFGLVYAGAGGGNTSLAAFTIRNFGEEYLQKLDDLEPRIFDSMSTQLDALARGEIAVTQVSFQGAYSSELAGAPIKLVVPEEGLSGVPYSMGITPAGLVSPAAKVFYNWTMSKAGQSFLASQAYAPARTDLGEVTTGKYQFPTLDSGKVQVETSAVVEKGRETVEIWKRVFNYAG